MKVIKTDSRMNSDLKEALVNFVAACLFLVLCAGLIGVLLASTNPGIDQKCAAKGGQILHHPGDFDSCIYPAK